MGISFSSLSVKRAPFPSVAEPVTNICCIWRKHPEQDDFFFPCLVNSSILFSLYASLKHTGNVVGPYELQLTHDESLSATSPSPIASNRSFLLRKRSVLFRSMGKQCWLSKHSRPGILRLKSCGTTCEIDCANSFSALQIHLISWMRSVNTSLPSVVTDSG